MRNSPFEMLTSTDAFNIPLEGLHTETGPGVYEAAIAVDEGIAAADKAALFKTAVKEISVRHASCPHSWQMERRAAWIERPHPPEPLLSCRSPERFL